MSVRYGKWKNFDYRDFAAGSKEAYIRRDYEYDNLQRVTKMVYRESGQLDKPKESYAYTYNSLNHIYDVKNHLSSLQLQKVGTTILTRENLYSGHGQRISSKDGRGSTSRIVCADGRSAATYEYTDFGETTIHGGGVFV